MTSTSAVVDALGGRRGRSGARPGTGRDRSCTRQEDARLQVTAQLKLRRVYLFTKIC